MSRKPSFSLALSFLALLAPAGAAELPGQSFAQDVLPLLHKYCWDCHGDGAHKGELNLDKYTDATLVAADRKIWSGILFHIDQWTMPPAKRSEQPSPQERDFLAHYLDRLLNPIDPSHPDPGRVTLRRLNRVEYNHTVRDLFGVDLRPADDFPEDDTGYGFDNIGDVLALSPLLMERYLTAADRVLNAVLPPPPPPLERRVIEAEGLTGQGFPSREGRLLSFNGTCGTEVNVPVEGEYAVRVRAWASEGGGEPAQLELRAMDQAVAQAAVTSMNPQAPEQIEAKVQLKQGFQKLEARFLNDFYDAEAPDEQRRDRNLTITAIELEGPFHPPAPPLSAAAQRLFAPGLPLGDNEAGARAILEHFAPRCFRRALLPAELDRLLKIYRLAKDQGENQSGALRFALKAILVSPYFVFRSEAQPEADNPAQVVEIDEYALATRLSYWLWSTTPDETLLALAAQNQLRAQWRPQVLRLLHDPKARALPEHFGGQWLELRTLSVAAPDPARFPQFNPELAQAMRQETEELFHYLVQENRSVLEFLSADYSFLNQRLAAFYGIPGVDGDHFRKVSLDPKTQRQGILTHAGILTITSDPTRTSPVKRGKWVLENLLGITPPPPPPNVPALASGAQAELTGSVRQRLEAHRSKPGCASCHALMDPIGFGLENFNAIGQWRDQDGPFPVDSAGVLTTGQSFANASELSRILLTDRRHAFLQALVNKMLTYALGRGTEPYDRPAVEAILASMEQNQFNFESLILGISESLPFQKRRGDRPR